MRFRIVYSTKYMVDIGNHVFPTTKYHLVKERILGDFGPKEAEILEPSPATDADVLLVHTADYLSRLKAGALSREEILTLELPYSPELVEASLLCCGGTILASRIALEDGLGAHIGGGFHHAFPGHGEGFCVLNDIAVAVRRLMTDALVERALVVDGDLHQGNGTAAVFADDPRVFTFSIHQEHNYPFFKPKSSLDIGLRDRAGDKEYLEALRAHVPKIMSEFRPGFMVYVAGADPYKDDQLGGLALTKEGLEARDKFVFQQAVNYQVPVCVVLAGGYALREEETADIHYRTIAAGMRIFGRSRRAPRVPHLL